ncbi:DUF3050 domain-containing protein [Pedobacter sp. PWIIR3]
MSAEIEKIQLSLTPIKQKIVNHKVYKVINSIDDLRIFMRYHVYAVWDFMSLLKSLQINLTCTSLPWFPVGSGSTRALINEIVAGEESDVDYSGDKKSHFEMYLDAMQQCGADTSEITNFISALKSGKSLNEAYLDAGTPQEARDFVNFTFDVIHSGKSHNQAAIFTFGREDLIPNMFHSIVTDLNQKFPDQISLFKYYLDRHIEVDGDHHSYLALAMTAELCKNESDWLDAESSSKESLKQRINLWNGVFNEIEKSR